MGGGNNAQTMAADFALAGFKVNLCDLPQFSKNIEPMMNSRQIEKYGPVGTVGQTGLAKLEKVTTNVGDAIKGGKVITLAVPAFGQMAFYKALAPNLEKDQIVVTLPGNWGALKLFNLLKKMRIKKNVNIAETDRCAFICRKAESFLGPGKARVVMERHSIQIAAMPAKNTGAVLDVLKTLNHVGFPKLIPATNVIETSLNNSNIIVHGPIVLMNTGWLEFTEGKFMIYRDGATPSIGRCVDAIRNERNTLLEALGISSQSNEPFYEEIIKSRWVHDPCELGPSSLKHRYITEDIPFGLVPMSNLGDKLNVTTPVSDAMIELASVANQVNYWKEGITLEKLGLSGLKPEEILRLVNEGYTKEKKA